MLITNFVAQTTGLSPSALFGGPTPLVRLAADAAGAITIQAWNVPGVTQPTVEAIAAALAAPEPALSAEALVVYAQTKQASIRDGGISVNVGTSSAPVSVDVASDVNGRGLVTGSVDLINLASQTNQTPPSIRWINNDGSSLTLTTTQVETIGYVLGTFVQATYTTLGTVLSGIASGSIATTDAIESASWPATSR